MNTVNSSHPSVILRILFILLLLLWLGDILDRGGDSGLWSHLAALEIYAQTMTLEIHSSRSPFSVSRHHNTIDGRFSYLITYDKNNYIIYCQERVLPASERSLISRHSAALV